MRANKPILSICSQLTHHYQDDNVRLGTQIHQSVLNLAVLCLLPAAMYLARLGAALRHHVQLKWRPQVRRPWRDGSLLNGLGTEWAPHLLTRPLWPRLVC